MRAADDGYAARFSAFFVASSFFRFESESQLQPMAANAPRWAAKQQFDKEIYAILAPSFCCDD
jgi:hypothetical protein